MPTPSPENTCSHDTMDDPDVQGARPPLAAAAAAAASSSPLESDTPEIQAETGEQNNNPKEIVRGIASYLSLSDVESIGSLYSLISPPAYHQHTYTPRIRKIGSASPGTNSSYRFLQGHSHNRHGSTATLASIDDCIASDDDSELVGFDSAAAAAAGISMIPIAVSNPQWGGTATSPTADNSNDNGHMAETPGLIALSPIPLDEDERDDDENSSAIIRISPSHINAEFDYKYRDEEDEDPKNVRRRTTMHMKMIQEKLKDAVFRHPHSIRSYCRTSHRSAIRMKQKLSRSRSSTFCPHCHMLSDHIETSNSQNVGMDDMDNFNTNVHMQRKSSFGYYLDQCNCAEKGRPKQHSRENQWQAPHDHILQFLASSIFDNIPLSILFDISHQSLDTSIKVTHASLSITSLSAETLINLLVNAVLSTLDTLGHNLNPFTLLNNIFRLQREAMGKTGEVIATGIQSVATGVGSAGTACMHVFSKPDKHLHHSGGLGGMVSVGARSPRSGMVSVGQSLVEGLLLRSSGNVREVLISEKVRNIIICTL